MTHLAFDAARGPIVRPGVGNNSVEVVDYTKRAFTGECSGFHEPKVLPSSGHQRDRVRMEGPGTLPC